MAPACPLNVHLGEISFLTRIKSRRPVQWQSRRGYIYIYSTSNSALSANYRIFGEKDNDEEISVLEVGGKTPDDVRGKTHTIR